ncbi:hypothetical protein EZV62_019309 [Acer yangbiense]|uniref:HVA22-like protein n=1 Tax=Acer yangbiense TaxID=1000413 RepID=A0A5C7HA09_9ROSI|nr:hypothetical protein EZV62_019309 [Acer yangbiense]
MGFLGIVKFAVKCFDVLAWPLLGLVYPLHASIKATKSDLRSLECHKLVAYWVLFSFILLFEHSFHSLLQWLPFWPYMKLIITCCLVMPKFDGAFYVYQHLVCVHTKLVIDKLKDCKDLHSNKNNIQAEVQENGFQACEEEELVSTEFLTQDCNPATQDNSVDKILEREVQQLVEDDDFILVMSKSQKKLKKLSEINKASLIENDKNNLAAEKIKEISEKVEEAGGELSEIQVSNQVKEWTCSLCQVTTQSEITHISHLRGRRHKAACDELRPKNQQCEIIEYSAYKQRQKNYKLRGLRIKYVEYREPLWWCKICNISCSSIDDMDSHLYGKKHLALTREVNALAAAMSKVQ